MKTKHVLFSLFMLFFAMNTMFAQNQRINVAISGKSSGNITVGELIGKQLEVSIAGYTVASYVLVVKSEGNTSSLNVTGNMVTKEASNMIRTLSAGSQVSFTLIRLSSSETASPSVPDLVFTIIS